MRVLHVIPSLSQRDGGPTAALKGMVVGLAQRGIDVDVVTTRTSELTGTGDDWSAPMSGASVSVVRFHRSVPGRWAISIPLTKWLLKHASNYDLVHVHYVFTYPTLVACVLAKYRGIPYVLSPVGMLQPWALNYRRWKKTPYMMLVERRNLRNAAAVHATSEFERSNIRRLGLNVPIVKIPLGVSCASTSSNSAKVPRSETVKVLFLSRLHPIKGGELLIDAFHCIPERYLSELVFAGQGDSSYMRSLQDRVRAAGLEDRVSFVGFVTGEAKQNLLKEADLFVLPSYSESFGVAVAEAMAAGLPVIVTEHVGLADSIAEHGAGIVVRGEVQDLAAALSTLIRDRSRRKECGDAGRAFVESELAWTRVAERLVALYEDAISEHRERR